uniref:Class II aldolase/adducin N-terminal domain-containing protein n=3 Tax=Lygus hesperus TaxID=30085 RepID=A0A0K8SUP0_LYGHE
MSEPVAAEVPPHTNGVPEDADDDERGKMRPADIDADVKEMEKRKRVEMIMGSRLFREELERIIESQMKDGGGPAGLIQQIQDMVGGASRLHSGAMFKNSSCVVPINDIRGVESMGYAKGEKLLRCKLACVFRLMDLYGWTHGIHNHITARLNQEHEHFLVNPFGMLYHEITASSLVKVDMQGNVVEQGTTNFGVDTSKFQLHGAVHAARPDVKCVIHIHTPSVVAISSLKAGLLPLGREAAVLGEVSTHRFFGGVSEPEERDKIARSLGPINKVLLLSNAGALCCGETVEEAFYNVYNTVLACETQVKLMPMGIDNLEVLPDEARKAMYDGARKAPEGALPKNANPLPPALEKKEKKWRIGGMEFEALMRMLDNAGFRTGYIYRTPLVKGDPPKPRNDVEVPPAVSSLGYLLEEEEMYRQGQWKKGAYSKNDRTRWLNSPNVYQKVEILETGTTDPKKITKWVADGSPTHTSTPVKIDAALQFVPKNTNPKEFKKLQQQIKENRRADKITSGPQSHILEGVTWEEAKKLQDATISMTGDHVIQIGAASKGIIQRGFQHNATVYKTPYAKNPFDCVSDAELEDYKKVVTRKQKGDYYDEDASESEPLSSSAALPPDVKSPPSETEDDSRTAKSLEDGNPQAPSSLYSVLFETMKYIWPSQNASATLPLRSNRSSKEVTPVPPPRRLSQGNPTLITPQEPRVLRIETKTAPVPSQAEVVLSDVEQIDALLEQVEHDLPDPHVERSKSHRFPPVEGENTYNGDHSDAHQSTFSEGSKEGTPLKDPSTEDSKKEKKKKKGLRTPSFLKKKSKKKIAESS